MPASRFKPTPVLREKRRSQLARFALYDAAGNRVDVVVRDISSRGLSAAALQDAPEPNAVMRAVLDDGRELWGLVRWKDGNLFGVEFETPRHAPRR